MLGLLSIKNQSMVNEFKSIKSTADFGRDRLIKLDGDEMGFRFDPKEYTSNVLLKKDGEDLETSMPIPPNLTVKYRDSRRPPATPGSWAIIAMACLIQCLGAGNF